MPCKNCKSYMQCIDCEHRKYGGHKWEKIDSRKMCAVCGLISRDKYFVNDDRLLCCVNMKKQYAPKPRKPKEPREQ